MAKREQLAAECFEKYLSATATDVTKTRELRHAFNALVLDGPVRGLIERGEFSQIRSMDAGLYQAIKTVGAEELKALLAYVPPMWRRTTSCVWRRADYGRAGGSGEISAGP